MGSIDSQIRACAKEQRRISFNYMVEYKHLDAVFGSLSDPTRRDLVRRLAKREYSVTELAAFYEDQMSLAAIAKHLQVLERGHLVRKRREGKRQIVSLSPPALEEASKFIEEYRKVWEKRMDRLEKFLDNDK